jgi:15-cis-phytoene synthase
MTQANPLGPDYAQCEALLRQEDLDRWLACLFIPAEQRVHVHALYAFSFEIARIRERVSEPMLGEIRFQWWREILVGERGAEAAAHPVAAALLDTIAKFDLPLDRFAGLIDARLFDLYDEPMPSIAVLESYATATASNLFRLAADIVAPGPGRQGCDELAAAGDHAGIAYALTGLLRALPWHVANGQIYLPIDCLAAHGIDEANAQTTLPADLHADRVSVGLRAALADLRKLARDHLRAFDALMEKTKGEAGSVFLPARLCDAYLRQMEKSDYDPWRTRIELPQWRRQWILWRAARAIG